jgi:hypothetical protein
MKTKDYVKKYKLDINEKFDHEEFIKDLTADFISLIDINKGKEQKKYFENSINDIRKKWSSINNKTSGQLPEKLWNYFYATVIVKLRDEYF